MSKSPEAEFDLELLLLPAWAKQPADVNRYAGYEGEAGRRTSGRRERPGRGEMAGRRQGRPARRGDEGRRTRGNRFEERDRGDRPRRDERSVDAPQPLPELNVTIVPEEKGVEALARQIKLTGRAYPIFGIAQLVLKRPDRYSVAFSVVTKPEGQPAQPLWLCNLDDTIWLSEQDAVGHVLRKHLETFYQAEKTPTDPPKGTYTFVAQCSLSGAILGPPNFHDYQNKLRKLHAERFSRMPFEVFKSKVRIVKDEAVVKKWIEEQSWKVEYNCLNVPEPKKLASREEVEKHFRDVHVANIVRCVDSHTTPGTAAQQLPSAPLRQLVRRAWEEQTRFPIKVVTALSQQFAAHGLQFFKVNRTITHVSVARPHYLDLESIPVSEGVKRIVEFINATPNCTRKKIVDGLAPALPPRPAPEGSMGAGQPSPAAGAGASSPAAGPSPEQAALVADLHWLIHQGHVIEFANGRIETAKKPAPRPPKPEPAAKQPSSTAVNEGADAAAGPQSMSADPAPAGSESEVTSGGSGDALPGPPAEGAEPAPPVSSASETERAPTADAGDRP